jgi:hypothetical protein
MRLSRGCRLTFVTAGLAIAGLCAISIPILIHLLARQRRKPIEWAAMRFLIEAFRKHRRRLQLEQYILLATRCLILALLGVALARPILESAGLLKPGGSRAVYLVIDDGMTSAVQSADKQTAMSRHIKQAIDVVNTLGPGDAVGVVTAARPAQALLVPPSTDHGAVVSLLQSLKPRQSPTDFAGAFPYVRQAVDESKKSRQPTLVYLFSDFRNGSAALDAPLPQTHADATDDIRLLAVPPAAESAPNVQIVSIEPLRNVVLPGATDGSGQITVRLRRSGGTEAANAGADVTRVRLVGEGLPPVEPKVVQWQPGQTEADADFDLNYGSATDRQLAVTATIDDDSLNLDNQRHTILELRNQIRVLLVDRRSFGFEREIHRASAGQWIRRALEPLEKSPIQVVEAEPAAIDLADIRTAEVAIVPRPDLLNDSGWTILRQFVQQNGLLIIMPPAEVNVHQWTERFARDLNLPWRSALETVEYQDGSGLAEEQPGGEVLRLISSELAELARPVLVFRSLPLDGETISSGQAQTLLALANGSPMVVMGSPNQDLPISRSGDLAIEGADKAPNRDIAKSPNGLVLYMTVAPELSWTNLPTQPLMVPLFHEMIKQGLSLTRSSQRLQVGEQPNLARGPSARDVVGPSEQRISLDASGRTQQPLDQSGIYIVHDQSNQPIGKLAVNVDPVAGNTDVQSSAAVNTWLRNSGPWRTVDPANMSAAVGDASGGSPIAGTILALVLALVLAETLLARWFSHAYASDAAQSDQTGVKFGSTATMDLARRGAAA